MDSKYPQPRQLRRRQGGKLSYVERQVGQKRLQMSISARECDDLCIQFI